MQKAAVREGYGPLLQTLGRNIIEFMVNINTLHLNMSLGVPEFQPPDIDVKKVWGQGGLAGWSFVHL